MIGSSDFEKAFYLYTCKNPEYLQNIHEGFYENEEISTLHKITKGFYGRFSQIPTRDQVKLIARQDQFKEKITESIVDLVFDEPVESYDQDWLRETSEAWILWKSLDKSLIDTIEYVKTVKVNPDNVKEVIQKVKALINERNSISFDKDLGKDFFTAENHIPAANSKITTCHNFVDNFSGGYRTKSLVVYAGEQNVGKCAHKDTLVSIRNKKTGEIQKIRIEDFYNLLKNKR